jgi:fatty acid amide hydrolase 2
MNSLLEKSPLSLAGMIRNREISPVSVTETFINRIKRVNPDLNAVVVDRFDEAMEQARRAEEQIVNQDNPPPLLGVPCTIKEMISVESYPITCGSLYRESARSNRDAKVVRILREAGAIPLGLTNVPELGLWIETDNPVYGRTNNPLNLDRTSGGSSGGEAAIIRAGGSPFGLGSDMGGSIRIPSAFCGLYGHKSTVGTISLEGHFPQDHSNAGMEGLPEPSIASIGPMTRHATDMKFLFSLLQEDTNSVELSNTQTPTTDIDEITVHTLADPKIRFTSNTSKEQQDAVTETARVLSEEGATIKEFSDDYFYESPAIYTTFLEEEDFPETSTLVGNGQDISVFKELGRSLLFERNHTLPMLTLCLMDKFYTPGDSTRQKRMRKAQEMRTELAETLGENGILIMPPYPTVAPSHGHTLYGPFDLMYSAILNVLDLPVTSVPVGTNDKGLATGIQVVTAPGRDELGLDTAIHLEKLIGRPKPTKFE